MKDFDSLPESTEIWIQAGEVPCASHQKGKPADFQIALVGNCNFSLCPWVVLSMNGLEVMFANMGIDLGGRDIDMSQHFLDGTQVGAIFQ